MAITRAQQVRQMLEDGGMLVSPSTTGKRPGYRSARAQEVQGRTPSTKGKSAPKEYIGGKEYDVTPATRNEREAQRELLQDEIQENLKDFRRLDSKGRKFTSFVKRFSPVAKILSTFGPLNNRDFFIDKVLGSKNFSSMTKQDFSKLSPQKQEELFDSYMTDRMSGDTDAYGNTLSQGEGDGGMSDYERRLLELEQATRAQAAVTPVETPFAPNLRLLAGGGSTNDISLEEAKDMAPKGEFLAYINKKEANMLKKAGGSGIMTNAGIPSFVEYGGQSGFEGAKSTGSVQGDVDRGPGGGGGGPKGPPTNVGGGDKEPVIEKFPTQLRAIDEMNLDKFIAKMNLDALNDEEDEDQAVTRGAGIDISDVRYPTGGIFLDPKLEEKMQADIFKNIQFKADGGRAGLMDGGMMSPEGGIMDLESGRQMYFLGKLVKKATRAVKKIVKSPIGKAALAFGAYKLGGMGFGKSGASLFERIGGLSTLLKNKATDFGLYKAGEGLTGKGMLALGGGLTLAPFLFGNEEEEQKPLYAGADIADPRFIMANASKYTNPRLLADGGEVEPVAKKTMPLLDMDGKEMDLRAEGGFVPIGRMEKADDVPARLSKNEFVFTADAVRNAGDGDVDKGAEVMYNMMKNLESGGDVSEESQGLEGAREMFQTSQRLEEVL